IPILSLLARSWAIDASINLTSNFSILISWVIIIYFISNHSNNETREKLGETFRSTDTYLNNNSKKPTNLDYFIDIVADFGRIICIIFYGNDDGYYPSDRQFRSAKKYRSKITKIPLKLTNILFNFTQNGISIKNDHQIVQLINRIRVSLRT
ncbi:unnamed protein product, partial [marine sediment metagenome]